MGIFAFDDFAKNGISQDVQVKSNNSQDHLYLQLLQSNLDKCFEKFSPDILFYNAGTDCMAGDPLGRYFYTKYNI